MSRFHGSCVPVRGWIVRQSRLELTQQFLEISFDQSARSVCKEFTDRGFLQDRENLQALQHVIAKLNRDRFGVVGAHEPVAAGSTIG